MTRLSHRQILIAVAFALVVASCGGDSAPPTSATIISAVETGSTVSTTETVPTSSTTTTTLIPTGPPLIIEGDKNETVAAFQFLLNCNGYGSLTVDGSYGPATKSVVQAAQLALGRLGDGAPDELTFAELSRTCLESRRLDPGEGTTALVGNAGPEDPDLFSIALLADSTVRLEVTSGIGVAVSLLAADGTMVTPEADGSYLIAETGDYQIRVSSDSAAITFSLDLTVGGASAPEEGDWIIAGDGIRYRGTDLTLGDDAQTVIDHIYDFLGHDVRGKYNEFDTGWDDPDQVGFRGIFIEGLAFLFYGPSPSSPTTPETFGRVRFVGPGKDADGESRPDNYVTTAAGITVGDNLADLKLAYGDQVKAGSNSKEHYYRLPDSGKELCFYFGSSAPTDSSKIVEIATQCRKD